MSIMVNNRSIMVNIWLIMGYIIMMDIPSGYVKIAIENGHRNSGFTH